MSTTSPSSPAPIFSSKSSSYPLTYGVLQFWASSMENFSLSEVPVEGNQRVTLQVGIEIVF